MIVIPYILYIVLRGLSALSGFSCSVFVLCVNTCTFACCYVNVLSTEALTYVVEKYDVLVKALQFSVHDEHDTLVKIK